MTKRDQNEQLLVTRQRLMGLLHLSLLMRRSLLHHFTDGLKNKTDIIFHGNIEKQTNQ